MADSKIDTSDIVLIGAVGIGLYLLWPFLSGVGSGIASAAGAIGAGETAAVTGLANYYAAMTSAGQIIPQGVVVMPDGSTIAVSQLVGNVQNISGTNYAQFTLNGVQYYLCGPSDCNGNWAAVTAPC